MTVMEYFLDRYCNVKNEKSEHTIKGQTCGYCVDAGGIERLGGGIGEEKDRTSHHERFSWSTAT